MTKIQLDSDLCDLECDAIPEQPRTKEQNTDPQCEKQKKETKPELNSKKTKANVTNKGSSEKEDSQQPKSFPKQPGKPKGMFEGKSINISNCSGIHLGNNLVYNFSQVYNKNVITKPTQGEAENKQRSANNHHQNNYQKDTTEIPGIIKNTFDNIKLATESDFYIVKTHTYNWRSLAKKLCPYKLDDPKLDTLSDEQAVLEVLQEWSQANARNATVGILCNELWDIGEALAAKKLAMAHC